MTQHQPLQGKKEVDRMTVYAFLDKDSQRLFPPSVCEIFSTRSEAREEVKKHPVFYSNGKYVKCTITYEI